LNVEAAWAQGITGKNVTTAIMDDGNLTINFYDIDFHVSLFL
jgi:subtilisin family serine protease